MKKTQQHTAEEMKQYNKSYIEFMRADKKPGDEENKFRMPALPLLTLDGVKKKPTDNETKQPEVSNDE